MSRLASRRAALLGAVVLTAVVAFPLGVIAAHQFGDVSNTNAYHSDIDAIADAGVTTGCGGGNYCPSALVTREQMAAFMNRLGALGPGKTPVVHAATALNAENADTAESAFDSSNLDGLDSTSFARSDVDVAGRYTCPAEGLQPIMSSGVWAIDSVYGLESGTDGAEFRCAVMLPDGATIQGVDFVVADFSPTDNVVSCSFFIRNYTVGNPGDLGLSGWPTGGTTGEPGVTEIDLALSTVVDNDANSYYVGCVLDNSGQTSIVQIEVQYTTTGNLVH